MYLQIVYFCQLPTQLVSRKDIKSLFTRIERSFYESWKLDYRIPSPVEELWKLSSFFLVYLLCPPPLAVFELKELVLSPMNYMKYFFSCSLICCFTILGICLHVFLVFFFAKNSLFFLLGVVLFVLEEQNLIRLDFILSIF